MKSWKHWKKLAALTSILLAFLLTSHLTAEQAPEINADLPTPSLSGVEPQSGKAVLSWQKSAASDVPKIKVDAAGNGDVMTIREALELVSEGTIAVAAGTYSEAPFTIPNGVSLQGGYEASNWQWDPVQNVSILQASNPAENFVTLGNASSLRGFRISSSGRCVQNNFTGALVSNNTFQGCDEGILLALRSDTTVANNTFLSGRVGVHLKDQARVVLQDNLMTGLAQAILDERTTSTGDEISNNATYGNQTGDASNVEDLGVKNASPFPPDSGPARVVGPWELILDKDDEVQDELSKSFSTEPFTAIYLAYSLGAGDRLTVHAKDHYDQAIFDSQGMSSESGGSWQAVTISSEVVIRIRSNGDGVLGKTADGQSQNWAKITQVGEYVLPDFSLPSDSSAIAAGSEGQPIGAEGVGTASDAKISLARAPQNLPSFDELQNEEETVAFLEETIATEVGAKKVILAGQTWTDLTNWIELFSPGQEYSSRAPYEVADGRTVNAMLSALFASEAGQVNRLLVKEKTYEPAPNNFDGDLVRAQEAGYFLTTLTDWLKTKVDDFCPSTQEDCEPNSSYKYFVKPLIKLGASDCVEVRNCPLSPLYEEPLEEQPYVAFLNRSDLYNHEGVLGGTGLDSPTTVAFKNLGGGEGVVQGNGKAAGFRISSSPGSEDEEIPGGGAFINVLLSQASSLGRLKFRVTGTNPEFGKRSISVIRDESYYPAEEKSPNGVWRNFIDMRKYSGTLMRLKWANEDTYVIEAWGSVPDWESGKWYEVTMEWRDGRVVMKREVLDDSGKAVGQDLAGEVNAEIGEREGEDWSDALIWEYPGKLTADSFLIGGKEYAASVQGIYNDVRIFDTSKAFQSEVFVNHDRRGASEPIIFDSGELRSDPQPAGLLSAGEVYVHIENIGGLAEILDISEAGTSKLKLERKTLAGQGYLVMTIAGEEALTAQAPFPTNWKDGGRLELRWYYNPASDQTSFAAYGENTAGEDILLLANTAAYESKPYQGSFLLNNPVIRISKAGQNGMIGPAKTVLRYTGTVPSTTDTPKVAVGYKIYYGQDEVAVQERSSDNEFISLKDLADPDNPEYTLTGLADKERYYVALATVDQEGRESLLSQTLSFVASPEQDFLPPDPRPARIDQAMQDAARADSETQAAVQLIPPVYAEETESEQQELGSLLKISLGESLELDAGLSQDDGAGNLQYQWSLGTSPNTSNQENPSKVYVYPGTYFAKREVIDDEGAYREIYSEAIELPPGTDEWLQPSLSVWTLPAEVDEWKGTAEATRLGEETPPDKPRKPPTLAVDEPLYFTGKVLDLSGSSVNELQKIVWDFGDGTQEIWEGQGDPEANKAWRATHAALNFNESLEPEPLKHIYEQAGSRVVTLCAIDLAGHEACYEYTIYVEPVEILPANARLSGAGVGTLEAVGGKPPYRWYLNGSEVLSNDEAGQVFLNLAPGDKVQVKDSLAVRLGEDGASNNSAELVIGQADEAQGILNLNQIPTGEVTFVRERPEKIPATINFTLEAQDPDGYLATLKPWKFGDVVPSTIASRLPGNTSSTSTSPETGLATESFDHLGDYPVVLSAEDEKGNASASVVTVRVVAPELDIDTDGTAVLGVTSSAVSKVEILQRTAAGDYSLLGEAQPDVNGVFVSRLNEPGLAGKKGFELKDDRQVLARVMEDYSLQLSPGIETKASYAQDKLSWDFYRGTELLGSMLYMGDTNQDLAQVTIFEPTRQVPQIKLAAGLELSYRGNAAVASGAGAEKFAYYNAGGLSLKDDMTVSGATEPLAGSSLQKMSVVVTEGQKQLATIYLQNNIAPKSESFKAATNLTWQPVEFAMTTGVPTEENFYVAIYDQSGKRYQYPSRALLSGALTNLDQTSFGVSDGFNSYFFKNSQALMLGNNLPSIFGVLEPNTAVEITINSSQEQLYRIKTDARGAFSLVPKELLSEGEHEVSFDWNGQSQSYKFQVDTAAPATPTLTGLQAGRIVLGVTEPGVMVAGYSYGLLEEVQTTQADGQGNFQLVFNDSSLKYRVLAYDEALNYSPALTHAFQSENEGVSEEENFSVAPTSNKLKWGIGLLALAVLGLIWLRRRSRRI